MPTHRLPSGADVRRVVGAGAPVALLAVLAAVAVVAWEGMPTDLAVYRRGALDLWTDPAHLYPPSDGRLPFTYPPLAAAMFWPLAILPPAVATAALTAASVAALARSTHLVARRAGWPGWRGVWAVPAGTAIAVCLDPVWTTLDLGQINLVLLWAVLEDLLAPPSRPWRGVLVGLAAGIKLTPAVFVLVPLLRRQGPTVWRAVGTLAAGVAVGFAAAPTAAWEFWTSALWDPGRIGAAGYAWNQSLYAVVVRATASDGGLATWALCAVPVAVTTCLVASRYAAAGQISTPSSSSRSGGCSRRPSRGAITSSGCGRSSSRSEPEWPRRPRRPAALTAAQRRCSQRGPSRRCYDCRSGCPTGRTARRSAPGPPRSSPTAMPSSPWRRSGGSPPDPDDAHS